MKDKYKNKSKSMRLVAESLNEFKLFENMEEAEEILASMGLPEDDPDVIEFKEILKDTPEYAPKFAEWYKMGVDVDKLGDALSKEKEENIQLDKDINDFISFREYSNEIKQKENKKEPENLDLGDEKLLEPPVRNNITDEKSPKELEKELKKEEKENNKKGDKFFKNIEKQAPLLGYRLWLYAVYDTDTDGNPYVKFGETYSEHKADAEKYAMKQTMGKVSGLLKLKNLIFCEDVTEFARQLNSRFVNKKHQEFDNFVRNKMPGRSGDITNDWGVTSTEVHLHDKNESYESIKQEWLDAIKDLVGKDLYEKPKTVYEARPFHKEMRKKISENKNNPEFDKFLLAAATGSGKEVTTIEQLIYIHDFLKDRGTISKETIHVSCATIPSTELELIEELSEVSGMDVNATNITHTEFNRIKGYCTLSFAKGYYNQLSDKAKTWFEKNITPVKTVSDIPENENFPLDVPVLFGSFNDLGMKANAGDPGKRYEDLKERIGILAIGEAHKFLSNISNKMWPALKEKYNFKFLLLITGTPYDYIFNETSNLYFSPEERTLFTRSDLYDAKRKYLETGEGDPAFAKYPDIYYYKVDVEDIIEQMKNNPDEPWEGNENGFTFTKFFEFDKKKNSFVYEDAIIYFFKRLLSVNSKGKSDELSIHNAQDLCEYAKRHIIIALPVGTGGVSVHQYIPELVELLNNNGALGKYNPLVSYDDKLGDVKEKIKEDKNPTAIFTCNKLLTGTNVPAWGSILFLRPIGNSIKFFEQATGRIGRAFDKKEKNNVGIFLGDINNAINIHVAVDEKLLGERDPNKGYDEIKRRTFDNYFFFGSKHGKWNKFEMADFNQALEDVSGEVDYRFNLALNKPKPPEDFDLEFSFDVGQGSKKVDVTDPQQSGEKNSEIARRVKQLKINFDNARDKEKWYRNMLKTHISKILIICLMKGFESIGEFSNFIKKAIINTDIETLDIIGPGAVYIPQYIDDNSQIDINYLNRWLERIIRETSKEDNIEGIEERYKDISSDMNITKLSEDIIFDPLPLTDEICSKISDQLKNSKEILTFEKNGAFIYSIIKQIGIDSLRKKKITICIFDKITEQILSYILGENILKRIDIKYIKYIEELKDMEKFDVIVGNPPFQKSTGSKHKNYPNFINISFDICKENGYVALISPLPAVDMLLGRTASQVSFKHPFKDIKYLAIGTPKEYFDVGSTFCYFIVKNTNVDSVEATVKSYNLKGNIETVKTTLRKGSFLPYKNNKISNDIIKKVLNGKNEFNRKVARVYDDEKTGDTKIITKLTDNNFNYAFTDKYHKDSDKSKIIVGISGNKHLIVEEGENIMTGSSAVFYILTDNKLHSENIIKFLESDLVTFVMEKLFNQHQNKYYYATAWFKVPPLKEKFDINKIYKFYGLSNEEINYIESQVK